jgi:membrane protease YdiL (CAAX protease family)
MLFKSHNSELWNDFFQRLRPSSIKTKFVPIILLLFPCAIVFAIIVSIFFGQPIQQLSFIPESGDLCSKGINLLAMVGMASVSGPFEEIGWRGYGMDSLLSNWSLIKASLLFGAIWSLFHVPAFFINGLQAEFWNKGLFQIFLYFTTLLFLTIIINWLYMKNNRSILAAILFHSIADICLALFHITPVTWFLLWVILLFISLVIIYRDKNLFFGKI